jgi:hypothetical protein
MQEYKRMIKDQASEFKCIDITKIKNTKDQISINLPKVVFIPSQVSEK